MTRIRHPTKRSNLSEDQTFVYPMRVVERLTGLTRRQIRYYEKAGLVHPSRSPGGHRLYSPENVEILIRIKALMESGVSTLEAVKRIMAAGLDGPSLRLLHNRSDKRLKPTTFEADRLPEIGDAPVRLMRSVLPTTSFSGSVREGDWASYFGRNNAFLEARNKDKWNERTDRK